ncbi:GNAT family N-acetyltransferase [Leuconostoc rapi]|nr:GNAT family N-acetyltransferase [Leuconostoc rapi]MBM7435080.1 RimJ/RimL family protein N-acetyltransferase [Leuconostoc rapi]
MLYEIRRATPNDNLAIGTFYEESLPYIDPIQTSWVPGIYPNISDALAAISKDEFFICLDEAGAVIGSVILNTASQEAYQTLNWSKSSDESDQKNLVVHTLITHPKRLKKGIASQIIAFIKTFAVANNMRTIQLDTLVDNIPARRLYEKNEFVYIGRRNLPSFDNQGIDDCVFYEFEIIKA